MKTEKTPPDWFPPKLLEEQDEPAHPPELRFQEQSRHNPTAMYIRSVRNTRLQLYDPVVREILCEALTSMDERITDLEERVCFFESSGAVLQKSHMTVAELARYLNYTKCSIYNMTRRRQIPFHKHKRHVFFIKKEIDEWIRTAKPTRWEQLGVTPESVPVDFNETMTAMRQRAADSRQKEQENENDKKHTNENDQRTD
jgi:excisionase family DNA binding protein